MEKMILVEYANMKEEIKDLRKRIQKLESEIGRLENSIVTDSVSCGKKGKKSLGTVKVSGGSGWINIQKTKSTECKKKIAGRTGSKTSGTDE